MAFLCLLLWRAGRRTLALLSFIALAFIDFVELAGKVAIAKPVMTKLSHGVMIPVGFHHSFPSGHVARATILAATATYLWPRLWPIFAAWVAVVVVTADLDAIHTPSDLFGGALLATAVILGVLAIDKALSARSSSLRAPDGRHGAPTG
jgi:membrane-associated phospholipid phosphatase